MNFSLSLVNTIPFKSHKTVNYTIKILKIRTPQKIAVTILKFEQNCFTADELAQKM